MTCVFRLVRKSRPLLSVRMAVNLLCNRNRQLVATGSDQSNDVRGSDDADDNQWQ